MKPTTTKIKLISGKEGVEFTHNSKKFITAPIAEKDQFEILKETTKGIFLYYSTIKATTPDEAIKQFIEKGL